MTPTPEPTLASIPGILLRTVARLFARIFFIIGGILVLVSVFLMTWRSARTPRAQQWIQLGLAVAALVTSESRLRQNASD